MLDPRNGSWERELEKAQSGLLLPDSRLKYEDRDRARVKIRGVVVDRLFCADCGKEAPGGVLPGSPFVFYLCDSCFAKSGTPPGTVKIVD